MRISRNFIIVIMFAPLLALLLPGGFSAALRNSMAGKLAEAEQLKMAEPLYAIGRFHKEPLATNNWLVLQYYKYRHNHEQMSMAEKKQYRIKARVDWDAVGAAGVAAGYYNAAMICFNCSYKTGGYRYAVARLEKAIADEWSFGSERQSTSVQIWQKH